MSIAGEFASFLHANGILQFGRFTLASGKPSPYYVDLRIIPGHPVMFRKVIKGLQGMISVDIGLDNVDSFASVPTGGLVITSALAAETLKPLAYVRAEAKGHGTSRLVEGRIVQGMRTIMIDDVATSGGSMIHGIRELRKAGAVVTDAYIIVDRLEGASQALSAEGVRLHSLVDIVQLCQELVDDGSISHDVMTSIRDRVEQS